ncbi:MAG: DNA cytosine methyltransferase, partial [Rhodocyclaceae bacterium]|nr:DNA cytosine methyltransferase [Rhodocyclaceae bacterium]
MPKLAKPTALDLFCGAGGLTTGLLQAGYRVLVGIEFNTIAAETYRMNHKNVLCIERDIRRVPAAALMKRLGLKKGELDLLAGCPPCQGFSTLRTRKQSNSVPDQRNDLVFEMLRFVRAMRPRAVMMENVPTLAADPRMKSLLTSLAKLGYAVNESSVRIEDAADYGVPQRRKRMIMIVSRVGRLAQARKVPHATVRDAFARAALPPVGRANDPLHDHIPVRTAKVAKIIEAIPRDGGSRTSLPKSLQLPCHLRHPDGFKDVYGRMKWDAVAPTMTGGCGNPSKGRYLHP